MYTYGVNSYIICTNTDVLSPILSVSSVTATSATLFFSQPNNSLSIDMYTVTLSSSTCVGVPSIVQSTASNSTDVDDLKAGIQYSVNVFARNNLAELTGTQSATLDTPETGIIVNVTSCFAVHT